MSNKSTIKCPNCQHEFEATDAFRDEVQRDLNTKAKEWQLKREDEYRKKEDELNLNLNTALAEQKKNLEENLKKTISHTYENEIKILKESQIQNEATLKKAREKELEFLRKEQELKNKEAELEINVQKKLQEERSTITEQIKKQEQDKNSLKIKELEKQLDDSKKLAEEMQRKAEQGSMQLQGEVQELALEELLKSTFPFDTIEEVGKGVKGADCIQHVKNNLGQPCGSIIYESKRTKAFGGDWIEKLKSDMRSKNADVAVLVSEVMPKDMEYFGSKDGVYICTFSEVKALAHVLRDSIIKISGATNSQKNKGDKMNLLYDYLTGNEFSEQWKAIREGFMSMKISIQRERDSMERLWKAREKQLDKVMINATGIRGAVDGIAGLESIDLNLSEDDVKELPE